MKKIIGVPVTYTIGFIEGKSQNYFEYTEQDAIKWISDGKLRKKTKLHSWLTLPSGEIVDLAFLPTFAMVQGKEIPRGSMIADYSYNLNGMKYIPMYLGMNFLQVSGALQIDERPQIII
ncbi:MAG: hypothetical protein QM484_07135 [Woeseiaceae bacterium]